MSEPSRADATSARNYMLGLGLGVVVAFVGVASGLLLLQRSGLLPAPPLSNSGCIDEKLAFLREHPPAGQNLLVLGSSVAWRHVDSAVLADDGRSTNPLNGAFCGLTMNQTLATADWLLARLPSIERAVLVLAPQDFERCAGVSPAFDRADADRFVFGHDWSWGFYLRYFDPVSLVRNVSHKIKERAHELPLDSQVLTPYGDGPLDTQLSRDLTYGPLYKLDPACFDALHTLARRFTDRGQALAVVQTPVHPEWKERYDPDDRLLREFHSQIERALEGSDATFWDADRDAPFSSAAFTDAIHLRWTAAHQFTKTLVQHLHP